ncbi:MAG: hypothetical protein ABMA25_11350 [Ilumatobacteraceae bacterium]
MAGLDIVMARVANDATFADALRTDPTAALRGYQLDASELARLEHAIGAVTSAEWPLFEPRHHDD